MCTTWSTKNKSRLSTASLFMHRKEKVSMVAAKHVGAGVEFASKSSEKNREAVDIFGKK